MTIKPDQYFMKMKCSGTVYSGRGAAGRRDAQLLSRRAFLYLTFLQGVSAERGPPGTRLRRGSGRGTYGKKNTTGREGLAGKYANFSRSYVRDIL